MAIQYVMPAGLHLERGDDKLREGYEVHWRDEENPSHYVFHAQVSVLRLERLYRDSLELLPPFCRAVLEIRRSDEQMDGDPDGPQQDRWSSDLVTKAEVLSILDRYGFQLLHDGMVGFGAYDPDSPFEVFLDDHKLLSLISAEIEPFESVLASHRVPHFRQVRTVLDFDHEHYTLPAVPDRWDVPHADTFRRRRLNVTWFARAIQRRLRMQLEPPSDAREPDTSD